MLQIGKGKNSRQIVEDEHGINQIIPQNVNRDEFKKDIAQIADSREKKEIEKQNQTETPVQVEYIFSDDRTDKEIIDKIRTEILLKLERMVLDLNTGDSHAFDKMETITNAFNKVYKCLDDNSGGEQLDGMAKILKNITGVSYLSINNKK